MMAGAGVSGSLPAWVRGWLAANVLICTWDASMITLRPHTLPGGSLHWLWKPYSLYIEVDTRYKDMDDVFVYCISLLNYVEVLICILILYLNSVRSRHTLLLALTVSVMTWWKTVVYLMQECELIGGGQMTSHVDGLTKLMIYWIPNGTWVVIPFFVIVSLWGRIVAKPGSLKKYS